MKLNTLEEAAELLLWKAPDSLDIIKVREVLSKAEPLSAAD